MKSRIRPFEDRDAEAVVDLSLRAWAPAYASLERVLGSEIFRRQHPDWRDDQRRAVEEALDAKKGQAWVAEAGGAVVGFVAVELDHPERGMGETSMVAVDPDRQGGIGTTLAEFALERLEEAGMSVAMVETAGDPGHAAAHVREGRLHPAADSPLLQEPVATKGHDDLGAPVPFGPLLRGWETPSGFGGGTSDWPKERRAPGRRRRFGEDRRVFVFERSSPIVSQPPPRPLSRAVVPGVVTAGAAVLSCRV